MPRLLAQDAPRVVVADDSEDQRLLLKVLLDQSGFNVVGEAKDGPSAVALVRTQRPDLVVLDLEMPGLNGFEAAQMIRAEWPEVKLAMLSSHAKEERGPEARQNGVDVYLEKGMGFPELVASLSELVGQSEQAGAPEAARRKPRPQAQSSDELVSFVVHELRTPVAVIEGFAATLVAALDQLDRETILKTAEAIQRSTKNLTALVDSFRDVRALETGTLRLVRERADLAELAQETVSDLEQVVGAHPLRFKATGPVPCDIDAVRVRQVLVNLVLNAAKYSDGDSAIEVSVGEVRSQPSFWVQDRGPGIDEERRAILFDKFSRFDKTVSGSGLGLYLSRGIARAHSGDLVYLPRQGGGSTFLASFGANEAADAARA